ncbi:unnamed protein product [Linum trigynum]|uniref:Uncharacterized protein n=1 Tax=Linum trigynum TaxID=586398 RepID=A0AAV2FB68_9ROSI
MASPTHGNINQQPNAATPEASSRNQEVGSQEYGLDEVAKLVEIVEKACAQLSHNPLLAFEERMEFDDASHEDFEEQEELILESYRDEYEQEVPHLESHTFAYHTTNFEDQVMRVVEQDDPFNYLAWCLSLQFVIEERMGM